MILEQRSCVSRNDVEVGFHDQKRPKIDDHCCSRGRALLLLILPKQTGVVINKPDTEPTDSGDAVSGTVNTLHARLAALTRHRGDPDHPEVLAAKNDLEAARLRQVIEEAHARLATLQGGDHSVIT